MKIFRCDIRESEATINSFESVHFHFEQFIFQFITFTNQKSENTFEESSLRQRNRAQLSNFAFCKGKTAPGIQSLIQILRKRRKPLLNSSWSRLKTCTSSFAARGKFRATTRCPPRRPFLPGFARKQLWISEDSDSSSRRSWILRLSSCDFYLFAALEEHSLPCSSEQCRKQLEDYISFITEFWFAKGGSRLPE